MLEGNWRLVEDADGGRTLYLFHEGGRRVGIKLEEGEQGVQEGHVYLHAAGMGGFSFDLESRTISAMKRLFHYVERLRPRA